ncbi:MAG: TraB domain-containing protein [Thermoplasmata archaeon]|nr:TraB domain-containing protein [Thermoplasmata archaeon]
MIKIVGVAHVINLRNKIYALMDYEMPDAVALELDQYRLNALLNKVHESKGISMFNILGIIQKRIASFQNVSPGEEMLAAYEKASLLNKPVFLIDMDIKQTYYKYKKEVRLIEKIKLFFSIFFSFIPRKSSSISLEEVLQNESKFIEGFRKSYPSFVKVLLDDREEYMARNLANLEKYGKVLAFVGDGHLNGLKKRLPDAVTIPLKTFLELNLPNNEFRMTIKL